MNDSKYGLQAGVFTNDINRAFEAHRTIEVGGVIVNDVSAFRADQMPYGGSKDSGFGREGLRYAMEEMTEPRIMVLRTSRCSAGPSVRLASSSVVYRRPVPFIVSEIVLGVAVPYTCFREARGRRTVSVLRSPIGSSTSSPFR